MGVPQPVYPAAMSTLAQTTTGPARWHATRVVAALLSFCAVVLVIVGSFLPLYSGTLGFGSQDIEVTITPWSADVQGPTEPGDVPTIGYPLVFAAIVLAVSAALCWYSATPAAGPAVGRVSGLTTAIGGAFLIGTVWTTALMVMNGVDSVLLLGTVSPGLETEATYHVGYWLLLVAALLSLGAAVLALIPVRQPTWDQVNADVTTPPYGIAMAAQAQPQSQPPFPAPNVLQVDPLTGHPLHSPPSGVPAPYPQPYPPAPLPPPAVPVVAEPPPAQPVGAPAATEPPAAQPPVAEPPAAAPSIPQPSPAEPPFRQPAIVQPPANIEPPATVREPVAGAEEPKP